MAKTCAVEKTVRKSGKDSMVCDGNRSGLLAALRRLQNKKGCISDTDMQDLAERFGIHPVEVYGTATFYSFLRVDRKARHVIRLSNCVSCGGKALLAAFEKTLKIKVGQTTADSRFALELTGCLGMCDQPAAIMVDSKLIGCLRVQDVPKILKSLR